MYYKISALLLLTGIGSLGHAWAQESASPPPTNAAMTEMNNAPTPSFYQTFGAEYASAFTVPRTASPSAPAQAPADYMALSDAAGAQKRKDPSGSVTKTTVPSITYPDPISKSTAAKQDPTATEEASRGVPDALENESTDVNTPGVALPPVMPSNDILDTNDSGALLLH